jgi:hypothetical protein
METQRGQMKGVIPWLFHWAGSAGTRDFCSDVAALVSPAQNIFFLAIHFFNSFVPIAQQAEQVAVLGRLSLSMCLCTRQPENWKNHQRTCTESTVTGLQKIFIW